MEKKVAVILLNWNNYKDTFDCLKSLENITTPNFEIFLVDNHSSDNSFNLIKKDYYEKKINHNIYFLESEKNIGFAGGNNIAIKKAYELGYYYFWLLNNDTVVDAGALTELINAMETNKEVGIVGSKIYYYETDIIWFAGGKINKLIGNPGHYGFEETDMGQYEEQKEVDYITGCSLMFRKELIDTVGLMDEDYFLYYEETDWNLRAAKYGWKIMYIPTSVIYHKVSSSSGGNGNLAPYVNYYEIRNPFMLIKRTQKKIYQFPAMLFVFYKFIKYACNSLFLRKMNRENLWYSYRGIKDVILSRKGMHPSYPIGKKYREKRNDV